MNEYAEVSVDIRYVIVDVQDEGTMSLAAFFEANEEEGDGFDDELELEIVGKVLLEGEYKFPLGNGDVCLIKLVDDSKAAIVTRQ